MYKDYFGFRDLPFSIAPDPRYLFMSRQHKEALAHLFYGVRSAGGFVLLTGEVGTGKTTVCRCLLQQLPKNVLVAFIINPRLTAVELLAAICDEFRVPRPAGPLTVKILVDRINAFLLKAHAAGKNPVLIIDEAQNLSPDVLEQLRLLTNLETNQRKLLQIILLGQPELRDMLRQKELRQLAQRITARFHLGPLNRNDVNGYVQHRLRTAGVERPLFSPKALNKLARLSGGVPRLINVICDRALLGVSCEGASLVTPAILRRAAHEVQGEDIHAPFWAKSWKLFLAVLVVSVVCFAGWQQWPITGSTSTGRLPIKGKPVAPKITAPAAVPSVDRGFSDWLGQNMASLDKAGAFRVLFDAWQADYRPDEEPLACHYAQTQGLRCLHGRGNLGMLKRLDRPAVLTLLVPGGPRFYMTLLEIHGDRMLLAGVGKQQSVHAEELERYWLGEFSLAWRAPQGYEGALKPGMHGALISWLDGELGKITGLDYRAADRSSYEGELLQAAKGFQASVGLEDDGVVGPKTLIRLNTASGAKVPRLLSGEG